MAQFKPIMVEKKEDLNKIPIKAGQYIVITDEAANEVYLDKTNTDRIKVNQNVFMQSNEPDSPRIGDIWIEIENEKI